VHEELNDGSMMVAYLRQQRFLASADNPANTPAYNKVWLDSVNDHAA
jgi:hypothetical protein